MRKVMVILSLVLFLTPIKTYAIGESAHSITVMDIDSGRVLYGKNQNEESLIASITKIMTI